MLQSPAAAHRRALISCASPASVGLHGGTADATGPFVRAAAWGRFAQKQTANGLAATSAKVTSSSVTLAGKPLDPRPDSKNHRLIPNSNPTVPITQKNSFACDVFHLPFADYDFENNCSSRRKTHLASTPIIDLSGHRVRVTPLQPTSR